MAAASVNDTGMITQQGSSHHADERPVGQGDIRTALLTPVGTGALQRGGRGRAGYRAACLGAFFPRGAEPLQNRPDGAIVFGSWRSNVKGPGEDLVVVRRTANAIEIHCHGGLAAAEAVMTSLEQLGVWRQTWPAWLWTEEMAEIEREARVGACPHRWTEGRRDCGEAAGRWAAARIRPH